MLVGLFFNEVMLFGGIIFWAMPSARATPGSLTLGYCYAMNQALRIPIAIFCEVINFVILFFGRCFRKIKTMPLYKKQTHKKTRL